MKNAKNTNILANLLRKARNFWTWIRTDKKRLIISIIILLVAVSSIWYLVSRNATGKVTYQTSKAERGTIVSSISASGQILTSSLVNVGTQATGVVKTVYVKNGDKVYAGQKIAEITLDSDGALANTEAWASLVSAQNSYRVTQASLANVYDQIKGHDLDETFTQIETRTKAEVANDNAYVNLTVAGLSYRQTSPVIVAPMTGVIDNITIASEMVLANSTSSTTTSSNRVAVIRSGGNPIATFNVSEIDVSRIKQGQKATITLDSIPDKTFTGKVMTVDKIGTVSSGVINYPVVISFDTAAPEILPNMAATANIIVETKTDVLLVPSEAVQIEGEISVVRILRNGETAQVQIQVGISSDTQTEVVSGINEGDEVIVGTSSASTSREGSTSPFSTFGGGGR